MGSLISDSLHTPLIRRYMCVLCVREFLGKEMAVS